MEVNLCWAEERAACWAMCKEAKYKHGAEASDGIKSFLCLLLLLCLGQGSVIH